MKLSLFNKMSGAAASVLGGVKQAAAGGGGGATAQRKDAMRCLNQGREYYNQRRYADAEDAFMQAVAEDPAYARAHYYLGNTLHKLNRPEEAVVEWQRAINADPVSDVALKAKDKLNLINAKNAALVKRLEEGLGFRQLGD